MPIAVLNPSSLYTIKPINHLTHRDIVERFVSWIERIRPILTALCRVMWLDISCDLLAPTVRWAWIHVGYKSSCTPRPAVGVFKKESMSAARGAMKSTKVDGVRTRLCHPSYINYQHRDINQPQPRTDHRPPTMIDNIRPSLLLIPVNPTMYQHRLAGTARATAQHTQGSFTIHEAWSKKTTFRPAYLHVHLKWPRLRSCPVCSY